MVNPTRTVRTMLFVALSIITILLSGLYQPIAAQPLLDSLALTKRQPELLARSLSQLESTRASQPQLYFVGFAGYGRQSVFKREVLAVRQMFDDRFGTTGRSIALINHPSTANETPLATTKNLDAALQHVGKLMDVDRDTLFLFLSSHGVTGTFIVEMPGLALKSLKPEQLKGMLLRSGIKRQVIVVSSCHSGSFIPALAGPTALVITAARSDRSSFGCDDGRRWTYFGDAFFNRALREETSFRRAFASAKRLITLWEVRDRFIPSLPQMAGGEALTDVD